MQQTEQCEKWKIKRRNTNIGYALYYFLNGIERSANTATLWIYMTSMIHPSNPTVAYGVTNTGIYFAPIFFSPIIARYADRTRRFKLIIGLLSICSIAGNILYIIPFSFWFPFIGKFLNGFLLCVRPLICGETSRMYPKEELQKVLPVYPTISAFGFAVGPCLAAAFIGTTLRLGSLQISYGNISGVILLLLTVMVTLLHIFVSHDISREFDLKQSETTSKENESLIEEESTRTGRESCFHIVRLMITTPEILVLILLTFYSSYLSVILFRYLPILVLESMKLQELVINTWYLVHAVLAMILFILAIRITIPSNVFVYYGIVGLVQMIIVSMLLLSGELTSYKNLVFNIIELVFVNICYTGFEITEHIVTTVVIMKLVSSDKQCFVESIRVAFKHIGSLTGAFMSGILIYYLVSFSVVVVITTVVFIFCLCWYRETYCKPYILI